MTITFWIGYTFMILLQSWSFTFVSRARNSGSLGLHALASIVSSAIWIIAQMFTLSVLTKAVAGGLGLGPTIVAIEIYSLASMAGSLFAHWIALKTESGKTGRRILKEVYSDYGGRMERSKAETSPHGVECMKYAWIGLATVGLAGLLWVQYEAALLLQQTRETVESVRQQVNAIPLAEDALLKRVDKITEATNTQLTALNKQIAIGRRELLRQTETVVRHTDSAIDATTPVLASANAFVMDADKVIANDEIPKVIHNARLTTAFAGQAAVHIEGMANTIDQATPGFLKSAQAIADSGVKLADSGSKIASDFQQITDKAVAPVPAWKQSIGYITAVVKIGSVFF